MKKTTWTTLIMELLCRSDDLISTVDIVQKVNCSMRQAFAALHHLRKRHTVEVVVDKGSSYWFATPDSDNRGYKVEEREEEEPGSRVPRKRKKSVRV